MQSKCGLENINYHSYALLKDSKFVITEPTDATKLSESDYGTENSKKIKNILLVYWMVNKRMQ